MLDRCFPISVFEEMSFNGQKNAETWFRHFFLRCVMKLLLANPSVTWINYFAFLFLRLKPKPNKARPKAAKDVGSDTG